MDLLTASILFARSKGERKYAHSLALEKVSSIAKAFNKSTGLIKREANTLLFTH
jgi:hypothetical protein